MYVESKFDKEQWDLLMRISNPDILVKNGKYYIDDKTSLSFFPVLRGTPYCEDKGISKKMAESIKWSTYNASIALLKDNFDNFIFEEHSLFLLKEHIKLILKYSAYPEMIKIANEILEKLNAKINV